MQEDIGILMHKDIEVADILFVNAHPVEFKQIKNKQHLPPGVNSAELLVDWLEKRNMPFDRPFCNAVLDTYGIKSGSDFSGLCHNVSFTDCYWFADPEEIEQGLKWRYISPWMDHVEWSVSGEYIFVGHPELVNDLETPDFGTGGYLPKVWVKDESNGVYLLKRDGRDGMNVFAEIAASQIAEMLNISHIPYFFSITENEICSGCPCLLTSDTEEMIPLGMVANEIGGLSEISAYIKKIGYGGEFGRMNILDFIIGNWDRSTEDVAVVRNPDDLHIFGFAPLYDHGDAFPDTNDEDKMRSLMSSARENIRHIEGKTLDWDELRKVTEKIAEEIELDNGLYTNAMTPLKERVDIFNQMVSHF